MKSFSWLPKFRSVPLLAATSPHTPSTSLSSIDDEHLDKVAGGAKAAEEFFSFHESSGAVTTPSGNSNTHFSSNQHRH
jgi:hypothetical protein